MNIDYQAIFAGMTLFGTIVLVYVKLDQRVSKVESKVEGLEKSEVKIDTKFEQIMNKLEEMRENNIDSLQSMNQKFNELILEFTKLKK
jgi:chaperonin cofactor prefoldin